MPVFKKCDFYKGTCSSGCDFGWLGLACQYENFAIKQNVKHSDNLKNMPKKYADLANDYNLSTCSYTANASIKRKTKPWWKIWFPYSFNVWKMEFLTKESHLKYFKSFNVSVENVPPEKKNQKGYFPKKAIICYTHKSEPDSKLLKVECNTSVASNQVRITLSRQSQIVLCDVRIYGECAPGKYGTYCNQTCGYCANGIFCERIKGSCLGGCLKGYKASIMCDEVCDDGYFGKNCTVSCGNCKSNTTCDKVTGRCPDGCSGDYEDAACLKKSKVMMKSQVGVVVGCIIALLLLIAMSITAVLYLKRRRHKLQYANKSLKEQADIESSDTEQRCTNTESDKSSLWSKENTASNHISVDLMPSKIDKEHIDEYYNVGSVARMRTTEHSVFISQLKEYVNSCLADEDFLAEQFKKIPYGLQHSTNSAKKQWNLSKNRYKAMYAYDHSRVVLESLADEKGSDYINANFIQGYLTDNAYIASHGPFSQTLTDFWRMVWEKNVFTIVMLTNLVEKTKTKCIQYWTKVETNALIGDINIQTETEDVFADFTFRRLRISNTNIHFHYTAWPDKDVLRSPTSLIEFWQRVRQKDETKSYPWLVHCSAGVGRTGTFIALDKLYDQAIDQGFIDVSQCVKDLREQRVNMVQTKNQYIFLHKIMMEILVKWSPPIKSEDFIRVYDDLTKNDENTQKTKLLLQYESLNEEMSAGRKMEDVYEELKEEDEECKDISRPVFPSYTAKSSFILASLDRKTIDMWRLIFDQDVNLIITLPKGNENESEEILPDTETLTIGPFKITLSSTKQEIVYTERCFSLVHHSQERVIKQIIYKQWTSTCPKDPFEMLRFLQDKEQIRGTDRTKPTLIQTLNGVERSGLVIVLVNILERLRFNNEVSIPQVIRHLKSFHDQIIPNYEQFHFCNKVVKCLIESEVTYANA